MMYKSVYLSPLGELFLVSDGNNLTGLYTKNQKYLDMTIFDTMVLNNDLEIFKNTKIWLDKYFHKKNPAISDLKIAPEGSEFRKEIWSLLCKIPYGQTVTYDDLAKEIAVIRNIKKMSPQAVGGAVGHNPISIIIPCHRVIGKNGSLTGYAGGLEMKKRLLEMENYIN